VCGQFAQLGLPVVGFDRNRRIYCRCGYRHPGTKRMEWLGIRIRPARPTKQRIDRSWSCARKRTGATARSSSLCREELVLRPEELKTLSYARGRARRGPPLASSPSEPSTGGDPRAFVCGAIGDGPRHRPDAAAPARDFARSGGFSALLIHSTRTPRRSTCAKGPSAPARSVGLRAGADPALLRLEL